MTRVGTTPVFALVQSPGRVWLLATPWAAARQASLSLTVSQSLPEFMSIESMTPSNHLILCCPLLLLPSIFPSIRAFSSDSDGQSIRASVSILPKSIQVAIYLCWSHFFHLYFSFTFFIFTFTYPSIYPPILMYWAPTMYQISRMSRCGQSW